MKKTLYFIAIISLLLGSSCTNDLEQEITDGKISFNSISASMGDLPTSRAHIENGGRVVWDVNDQIGIISDTQTEGVLFTCTNVDDSKASFTSDGKIEGSNFIAYYPYKSSIWPYNDISIDENIMTYELPRVYSYDETTRLNVSPIIAKSNTNEFKFKHTCGVIKFSITGTQNVQAIYLMGNNNEIIAGTGTIDLSKDTPIFTIMPDADIAWNDIVMFGTQLSSTPTEFYCIVPVMNFTKGLSLSIQYYDEAGEIQEIKKTTSKEIKISRSVIKSFSTFDLNDLIEQELEEEKKEEERIYNALMTFYNATGGANWTNNTNWGSDKPYNEWYGLDADGKNIYSISLANNNLTGYIPEEIGELNNLRQLYLAFNNLGGAIPESIGHLKNLQNFSLLDNKIEGQIPESIGELKELNYLTLVDNRITGAIPSSICNLEKLKEVGLDNNRLRGELPKNMGNMTALEIFDIGNYSHSAGGGSVDFNDPLSYYNQISGEIPQSITKLPNLKQFGAINNKLSGNIPDEIWSMPSLTELYLTGNMLTGSIPSAISNAKKLEQLWLENNHLTGPIPEEICELTNLKELLIGNANMSLATGDYSIYQYNKFEGGIPNNINKLTNLIQLEMGICGLSGSIPTSLYTMDKLEVLGLQNGGADWYEDSPLGAQIRENYNHISDTISHSIVGMTNLSSFDVGENEIKGSIPKEFGSLLSLDNLSLRENKISGTIPVELGKLKNLHYLHLQENNIEGSIPKEFANLTQLESLILSGNRMSGDIPEEITSSPMWSTSRWNPVVWIIPQQEGYGFTGYTWDDDLDDYYSSSDYSADGEVNTLQTASVGNGIDIVLMGDGYSDRLIADGTYDEVMNTAMEKFFSEEPYKSYRNMFNVYSVTAVSKNEVYANGSQTAFSGFFGGGTHVGGNDQKAFEYALKAIDEEQMDEALIVIMMNSINYAGTCYMYHPEGSDNYGNGVSISYFPVGIDDTALAEVLHHEAGGHGFAKLADEYAYPEMGKIPMEEVNATKEQQNTWGWWKNVDFTNDLSTIRWNYFIDDTRYANDGLGAYEGGLTYWRGVWRPTENSIMLDNTGGFNAPSREAIYYRMHKLAYGDSWEYNYEDFVEYDAINRNSTASRSFKYVEIPKNFEPLHAPITIKSSWKNAKNNSPKKKVSNNSNLYKAPAKVSKPKTMPSITKAIYSRTPDGKLQSEIKTEHIKE